MKYIFLIYHQKQYRDDDTKQVKEFEPVPLVCETDTLATRQLIIIILIDEYKEQKYKIHQYRFKGVKLCSTSPNISYGSF